MYVYRYVYKMAVHYLESLVRLLVTIVELEPSVCKTSHILAFLGAYSATRTKAGICEVILSFLFW